MSESESDKKRNKLGYQRISVACAHCRRRKIRCVKADGDSQNRCQNCIRLNKECVFYPVDQQAPPDRPAASSSRTTGTPTSSTVSQSPQDIARSFDNPGPFGPVPSLPSNAPPQAYPMHYDSAEMLQSQSSFGYDYRSPELGRQWSESDELSPHSQHTMSPAGSLHGQPWQPHPGYMGFNPTMQQNYPDTRSYSFPGPEDGRQWQMLQQQGRAMSYGHQGTSQQSAMQHSFGMTPNVQSFPQHMMGTQSVPVSRPQGYQLHQQVYNYQNTTQPPSGQNAAGWYHEMGNYGQGPSSAENPDPPQ